MTGEVDAPGAWQRDRDDVLREAPLLYRRIKVAEPGNNLWALILLET